MEMYKKFGDLGFGFWILIKMRETGNDDLIWSEQVFYTPVYMIMDKSLSWTVGALHYAKDSRNFSQNSNGKVHFDFF